MDGHGIITHLRDSSFVYYLGCGVKEYNEGGEGMKQWTAGQEWCFIIGLGFIMATTFAAYIVARSWFLPTMLFLNMFIPATLWLYAGKNGLRIWFSLRKTK